MGLDAFVRCNCFWEGRTSEPPFARELVTVDEEGCWDVAVPHEESYELSEALWDWRETACRHPMMELASERVCNWAGKEFFLRALQRIGTQYFPVLWNEFPQHNGGQLTPEHAAIALQELARLQQQPNMGAIVELIEEDGNVIWSGEGVWMLHGSQQVCLMREGLSVLDDSHTAPLFQARRVAQQQLDAQTYRWRDLDSQKTFDTTFSLTVEIPWPDGEWQNDEGRSNFRFVERAGVVQRALTAKDLNYIIQPLEKLFRASIESGNPVVWT